MQIQVRTSRRSTRSFAAFLSAAAAAVVTAAVLMAVAAVPASATTATTLTVTAQSAKVTWNKTLILNGTLRESTSAPRPLDQKQVAVQRATAASGPWTTIATVTNTAGAYYSGAYTYSAKATRTYYWRMSYAGDGEWAASVSAAVKIGVKPALGKPSVPKTVRAKKAFKVTASVKPRFKAGSKSVKLCWQIRKGSTWKAYKTVWAKVANSGSYSKAVKTVTLTKKGKYRFYTKTQASSKYALSRSAFSRTLTVK